MSFHPNDVARRSRGARGAIALAFALLGGAFYRAQVLHHSEYVVQSEENRLREVPLPAPRGIIYDRHGQVIAENLPGYTVSILSPSPDSLRESLKRLNAIIPYSDEDIETAIRRFRRAPNRPAVILADADFQQVSVLEEHRTEFPTLIIQSTPKRWYPDSSIVAPFVGYTGEISEQELASPKYDGYKAGMRIGKRGLEQQYEPTLRGREGYRFVEVDARGRVVHDIGAARDDQQPDAGAAMYTNIDLDLQRFVVSYFADSLQGAAVVVDPHTGGVLALHSAPTFDPNRFTGGIPAGYWDSLNTDPRRPLYNKAIQGRYPPGSTFKLATAVLALENGVKLTDHMPVPCTGGFQYGRYWRCWNHAGHGDLNLAQAIEKSCDVYFYQLGLRMRLSGLVGGGVKLRFAEKTGIDLPSETRPDFPFDAVEYYRKKFPRGFVANSEALNLSIGQGSDAQTVINMAKFYTALATNGMMARPTLAKKVPVRDSIFRLTTEQYEGVRAALAGVVSSRGTANSARIEGLTIAGKTGTAQNPPNPDHGWFVGFAPAQDPQIVVAVFLEYGLHGDHAARVASKIIEHFFKRPAITQAAVLEGG
jgi:penicillin-binding protein 2